MYTHVYVASLSFPVPFLPPSLPAVHADWNMLSAGPTAGPVHGSVLHHPVCVDRTLPRKMPRGTCVHGCTYIQKCFSWWEIIPPPPPLHPPPGGCVRSGGCREAAQGDVCSARVLREGHGCLVPYSGPHETCLAARAAGTSLSLSSPPPPPTCPPSTPCSSLCPGDSIRRLLCVSTGEARPAAPPSDAESHRLRTPCLR